MRRSRRPHRGEIPHLLKLLLLLGVSGLLPARTITGLTRNWFTNYIVADASDDVQQQQLANSNATSNVTSSQVNGGAASLAAGEQPTSAYNFSDSISVRVGAQTPSALQSGGGELSSQTSVSDNINQTASLPSASTATTTNSNGPHMQDQVDLLSSRREDSAAPSPMTASAHYPGGGGASNHQNYYPIEAYPSASYTSLALQAPSPTVTSSASPLASSPAGATSSAAAAQASTLNSLLTRDYHHHHSFNLSEPSPSPSQNQNQNQHSHLLPAHLSSNHRGSTALGVPSQLGTTKVHSQSSGLHADAQNAYAQILNHNFDIFASGGDSTASSASTLNAQLIQNLTAGLFPVNKLSNSTLSSLSDLLSRTKQLQQQSSGNSQLQYGTGSGAVNGYRPNYGGGGGGGQLGAAHPSSQPALQTGLQAASQQANNYLEALLGDHRFTSSMFDYQPSSPAALGGGGGGGSSHFGFREPSSMARLQSPTSVHNRLAVAPQQQQLMQQTGVSSKQKHAEVHQPAAAPIPSNVYNTYAPYRETSSSGGNNNNNKPLSTNGQMLNMAATLYDQYLDQNYRQPQQQQQQYQFVQQHQANNQNHLDKVVYHSTPFRPSIVSPPSSSQVLPGHHQHQHQGQVTSVPTGANYQRPRAEPDVKSMVSHTAGSTHGQQSSASRQVALGAKFDDVIFDPMAPSRAPSATTSANASRFAAGSTATTTSHQHVASAAAAQTAPSKQTAPQRAQAQTPSNSLEQQQQQQLSGPQLLLDLYERAIDSQIQEAIYSDHQQHFQHLGAGASSAAPATGPSSSSTANSAGSLTAASAHTNQAAWPAAYDDTPTYEPSPFPSTMAASGSSRAPASTTAVAAVSAAMAALMNSQHQHQQQSDPLASALAELPTFSASDLQPLLPGGMGGSGAAGVAATTTSANEPVYSLLPPQGADQSVDASSLAALVAQLSGATSGLQHQSQHQPQLQSTSLQQLLMGDYGGGGGGGAGSPDQFGYFGKSPISASYFMTGASSVAPQSVALAPAAAASSVPSTSSGGGGGLPSIFTKLQSGQLSSILTSPFAHLYANLPRYRYTKQQQQQPQHQSGKSSSAATPTSSAGQQQLNKQQTAAAVAASAAANLIASAGQTLTPLQAAMLQAQLATSAYLQADAAGSDQPIPSTAQVAGLSAFATTDSGFAPQQTGPSHQAQPPVGGNLLSNFASGLAGGGVSPLVWRNFLAPIMGSGAGARSKQQSGLGGSSSQKLSSTGGVNVYSQRPSGASQSLALMNSLWPTGSGSGAPSSSSLSQLITPAASSHISSGPTAAAAAASYSEQPMRSAHAQKKPRLKIKILKIPVAFYSDAAAASSASTAQFSGTADQNSIEESLSSGASISLMPAHLQPSPTASLLATLACPYHHQHQHHHQTSGHATSASSLAYPGASWSLPSGGLSQLGGTNHHHHLLLSAGPVDYAAQFNNNQMISSSQGGGGGGQGQQATGKQVAGGGSSGHHQATTSQTTAASGAQGDHGKPAPIRDFTDINQPNDLQVSPSSATLPTMQQQQQQPAPLHQHHLRKS